jgi:hypothetical protein
LGTLLVGVAITVGGFGFWFNYNAGEHLYDPGYTYSRYENDLATGDSIQALAAFMLVVGILMILYAGVPFLRGPGKKENKQLEGTKVAEQAPDRSHEELAMKCPNCGYENLSPERGFCYQCGTPLESLPSMSYRPPSPSTPPKRLMSRFEVVLSVLVVFVVILGISVAISPSPSDDGNSPDQDNNPSGDDNPPSNSNPPPSNTVHYSTIWLFNNMYATIDVVGVFFNGEGAFVTGPIAPYGESHKTYWDTYWSLPATVTFYYRMVGDDVVHNYRIPETFYFGYDLEINFGYDEVTYSLTLVA